MTKKFFLKYLWQNMVLGKMCCTFASEVKARKASSKGINNNLKKEENYET